MNVRDKLKKSGEAINKTFNRFPLVILLFVSFAVITIYQMEVPYDKLEGIRDILSRVKAIISLGIIFSLCIDLVLERFCKKKSIIARIGIYALELVILYLYFTFLYFDLEMVSVIRLMLIIFSLQIAFFFIPYLLKKENFEVYVSQIITRLIISAIFTIVLALGLTATLFAIKSLLYSGLSGRFFAYLWILAGLVFAPIHFLYGLPKNEDTFTIDHFNKAFKVLLLYIVLPIICIYTVVLYLYFGKIIITQVWPKGIVSYLVLFYTAVGITAIFFISPFRKENKWVKMFTSVFTKAIFPLLIMMFISISIRISHFGFTENRYFILIIGIWATFAIIFININKGKNNIILPISLAIVAFLTVCGPWSAFDVSKTSQTHRFYNILMKYDMIQNDKVVNKEAKIEFEDQREIAGILRYFDINHNLKDLKYLPGNFEFSKMKNVFGFEEYDSFDTRREFSYRGLEDGAVEISGYDILFGCKFYNYHYKNETLFTKEIESQKGKIKCIIDNKNKMTIFHNDVEIYSYDLLEFTKKFYAEYGSTSEDKKINPEDLIIFDENDKVQVKYVIGRLSGSSNLEDEDLHLENLRANILIKIK